MLPFYISSIRNDDFHQLIFLLSEEIEVYSEYSHKYCLASFTMISSCHITSVIKWKGELFFYDGIKMSDTERFRPLLAEELFDREGSTVIYLLY